MKNFRFLMAALLVAGLAVACGEEDETTDGGVSDAAVDAGQAFTVAAGQYVLSNITFTKDECNLTAGFTSGMEATVVVTNNQYQIKFVPTESTPVNGLLANNEFTLAASKNADTIPGTNCQDNWTKTVQGTVTANNTFEGTYTFTDTTVSGTDCTDSAKIGFTGPNCTSTFSFDASKKPGT